MKTLTMVQTSSVQSRSVMVSRMKVRSTAKSVSFMSNRSLVLITLARLYPTFEKEDLNLLAIFILK